MNQFLKELADLLEKHEAKIWVGEGFTGRTYLSVCTSDEAVDLSNEYGDTAIEVHTLRALAHKPEVDS